MRHKVSERIQPGCLASSRKGRDKGHIYLISAADDQNVYGADGEKWTISQPKKKNRKHMQLILTGYERPDIKDLKDEKIKELIESYDQRTD